MRQFLTAFRNNAEQIQYAVETLTSKNQQREGKCYAIYTEFILVFHSPPFFRLRVAFGFWFCFNFTKLSKKPQIMYTNLILLVVMGI